MLETINTINIELKDKSTTFRPQDTIDGALLWSVHNEKPIRQAEIRLGWVVASQEHSDVMCHCVENFELNGNSGSIDFQVKLPLGPYSYTGKLFSIDWMIEARTSDKKHVVQIPISLK